ncbi:Rpn family recombination-promoting nuclease/putative transposase [Psychrobacillus sp. L4]|uniref:Rpn family recombination-promoting nuclease/putative transposase n=1 Tax=Psychrobacillus sp. L4 TaxID=3236892 RepID=UPI0036F42765
MTKVFPPQEKPNIAWMHQKHPTLFIHEKSPGYKKHDQLFKKLISNFFEEFLEAFFPKVHQFVDFTSLKQLSEEVYTDLIDGETRRLDIVMETKMKGVETVIIVHVEPQSSYQSHFNERMFQYYSLLYNKLRKPILPIAVFSYDENRKTEEKFTITFPNFHVLTFQYKKLELCQKDWRAYIKADNPAAAALMSKMGYTKKEKVQVKIAFLQMLVRMKLNPAQSELVNGFFEYYLKLDEKEEEELVKQINQFDNAEEFFELPNSWRDKGRKEGLEQGRLAEKEEIVRKSLLKHVDVDIIVEITGLSFERILEIKEKYNL